MSGAGRAVVLGLDPGLANFGWAAVELPPRGGERVLGLGVLRSRPCGAKGRVRKPEATHERGRELAASLLRLAREHGASALCVEELSYPPGAKAAAAVARVWGIVDALAAVLDVPVLAVPPKDLKVALAGKASASKDDVRVALLARLEPEMDGPLGAFMREEARSRWEHAFDALGAVVASAGSAELRTLRAAARIAAGA